MSSKINNKINNTLSKDAFFQVNKALTKHLQSVEAALVLAEIIFVTRQHRDKDSVFITIDKLMERCYLNRNAVRTALKVLFENEFIMIEKRGMPAQNYYTVFQDNINNVLDNIDRQVTTSDEKTHDKSLPTISDENTHDKSLDSLTTSGAKNSSHNNKVLIKKEPIKKDTYLNKGLDTSLREVDKQSTKEDKSLTKSIEDIMIKPESILTTEERSIKAKEYFQ